jgi:hypothetical protein
MKPSSSFRLPQVNFTAVKPFEPSQDPSDVDVLRQMMSKGIITSIGVVALWSL